MKVACFEEIACSQDCRVTVLDLSYLSERELENCSAYCKAKTALRHFLKHESFRPDQLAALLPVLHGKDVLAKMATGAGKSLCPLPCPTGSKLLV